ncbi:unnamed protein product [Paramecium octaurelia]|uniref:VWFA domain-containing protein n=1 Tax=Paramecium octaurelia TaxID=43137 RepID=A0A8S1SBH6_PAROT|nr:unnamed protein product [Paramecium octaurelia]
MGNQCTSGDNDSYANTTKAIIINEEFIEGERPVISQEHSKFNDDDAIDVVITNESNYGRKSLSQNYMKQANYVLQDNIQLQLNYCGLPTQGTQAVLLSVQTKNQTITTRQGIDLICLIDHSGSMSGEKMHLVKKSLKHLLKMLQPQDRLCLIEFDDQNYRLTRLMRATQENMYKFLIAIDTIQANGATDIGNAMKMALSILKHRRFKNPIASIFLLSDGEDEGAAGRVWDDIQSKNIKEPFTINTFGFGRDCCPKIMSEIAHFKEGQFYYISDIVKIDECFFEALGGEASVIAYNTHITVTCKKNTIKKVYGDKWALNLQEQSFSIYQPQLQFGVRKDFIVETSVPIGMMDEFITVKMHTDSVETGERFTIEQFINIVPNMVAEQIVFQEVMSHYYRVQAAETFRNALNLGYNLQYQQAQATITALQQQIYQMNLKNPMINLVYLDLQQALRYCDSMFFNQEGRHYLTQLYMIHMYQQPRGIEIVSNDPKMQVTCVYQNELQKQYILQLRQMKTNNPDQFQQ